MIEAWRGIELHCSYVSKVVLRQAQNTIEEWRGQNYTAVIQVEILLPQAQDMIEAWRGIELHCSYVSGSTITPSPGYNWGMEGYRTTL